MPAIVFLDLPTYPKGTLSLSLPYLASFFSDQFHTVIFDMNLVAQDEFLKQCETIHPVMAGLKVCAQNYHIACVVSDLLKAKLPQIKIVWGGEFPTLLPDQCFPYADSIVKGLFDSVAAMFINDLNTGGLQLQYDGSNDSLPVQFTVPDWQSIRQIDRYNKFMGIPLETSRGCTEVCTFCMVHTMQKKHYHVKPPNILKLEIEAAGNRFINIIDYNFGVNKQHVINTCSIIEHSQALGFMAEMCLDMLDDDEILRALQKARCKMIYCGLETIMEDSLKAIHKMNTNHISNYRRIISRAQRFGIYVASGFILAIDGTRPDTFLQTKRFFEETGIMYAKLTFLTYNPGTKVQQYYRKKGVFISEDPRYYDGNHLSYLPNGVSDIEVFTGTKWFIANFYSVKGIIRRSRYIQDGLLQKIAFICFNICYATSYKQWLKNDIFDSEKGFEELLLQPYRKSILVGLAERILIVVWKLQRMLHKNIL